MTVPAEAITAVAQILHRDRCPSPDGCDEWTELDRDAATRVLAAALPFLAEDGWDAARDRATEANQARRDERERCAQLAESVSAGYAGHPYDMYDTKPFADLLRKETTDAA